MSKTIASKLAVLVVFFLHCVLITHAQTRTVTGRVTDAEGRGVPGVTVTVRGTNTATQTSEDGSYSISAADNATLVFSSVGYASAEERVNSRSAISLTLVTENAALSEVVVIGYGTARRRDLTGAVTTVSEKEFNRGTYTSADQLIQGKVSGVQITNNSGQPGGATTVRIRGNSALTGSGSPLYVVDGVPLDGRSPRPGLGDVGFGGSNPGNNPLNFMNPADIASMEILKDASATAIYGSRAAYGVILITTKRGQTGQPKIDFSASYGRANVLRQIEVLDAGEFRRALGYYGVPTTNDYGGNVNAFDAITRSGAVQNYNVALSGGTENARYRVSLGALDQEGVVRKSGITKYTANVSANFKFLESKKFGLDINIIPSQYREDIAPITNNAGSRGSLISQALRWNPTEPLVIKRANGSDSFNVRRGGDLFNPLAVQEAVTDQSRVTTVLASISPSYKFTNWLEYRFLYSINYGTGQRRTTIQPFINIQEIQDRGSARIAQSELSTQQFTHTLNFNKRIVQRLNLNAVLGYEYLDYTNKGFDVNTRGLANVGFGNFGLDFTDVLGISDPTNRGVGSYNDPSYELQSYFGRTVFNFDDKYLLTATVRADGSTRFGKNNKYGYFPSLGVAWNISKEDFFQFDAISNLKLRAGWGKVGNQEFPSGRAQASYGLGLNGGQLTFNQINFENEDLKWQSDRQYNIGLDATVLQNKVSITVDYFNKRTIDLLYPATSAQPAPPGQTIRWTNLDGRIDNKGVEAAVNATIVNNKDFGFDFGVNATFLKNEVSGLSATINTGALDGQGITGTTVQVIRSGLPINAFFTRQFEDFDKATGQAIYTEGGDVLYYVGNPNPNKLFGISTTLRYKMFSFNAAMNGAFGHVIYNNTLNNVINVGSILGGQNIAQSVLDNPIKESFANPVTASSRFLEKGDYLKLTNATLSYGIDRIGKNIRGANVFITGQNLFVITKFSGFDPEVNTDKNVGGVPSVGIEYVPYPSARIITFGVNFSL